MAPANIRINPLGGAICLVLALVLCFYIFGQPNFITSHEERISMKELLSASIVLARRGGDLVSSIRLSNKLNEEIKGKTKEGAKEYVSEGDMQSHNAIFYGFAKTFPGLYVVSEEHEKKPEDFSKISKVDMHIPEVENIILSDQSLPLSDITVWIDPLDATQEYTEKTDKDGSDMLHYVTTMICVAVKGQPTIGVIHKPFVSDKGETTWAWAGYGHSSNLKKEVEPKEKGADDEHKVIVSRSHQGHVTEEVNKSFKHVVITKAGGAGYKTLEVINGNQDVYIHVTLIKKWDICAGNAILSALNGKMTTIDGKHIDYSTGEQAKNEAGLIASLYNHDYYREVLGSLKS